MTEQEAGEFLKEITRGKVGSVAELRADKEVAAALRVTLEDEAVELETNDPNGADLVLVNQLLIHVRLAMMELH